MLITGLRIIIIAGLLLVLTEKDAISSEDKGAFQDPFIDRIDLLIRKTDVRIDALDRPFSDSTSPVPVISMPDLDLSCAPGGDEAVLKRAEAAIERMETAISGMKARSDSPVDCAVDIAVEASEVRRAGTIATMLADKTDACAATRRDTFEKRLEVMTDEGGMIALQDAIAGTLRLSQWAQAIAEAAGEARMTYDEGIAAEEEARASCRQDPVDPEALDAMRDRLKTLKARRAALAREATVVAAGGGDGQALDASEKQVRLLKSRQRRLRTERRTLNTFAQWLEDNDAPVIVELDDLKQIDPELSVMQKDTRLFNSPNQDDTDVTLDTATTALHVARVEDEGWSLVITLEQGYRFVPSGALIPWQEAEDFE